MKKYEMCFYISGSGVSEVSARFFPFPTPNRVRRIGIPDMQADFPGAGGVCLFISTVEAGKNKPGRKPGRGFLPGMGIQQ